MLSTHNFRTLSIESSQTPLCKCLEFIYPKELICSATIALEKMLWISSPNPIISNYDRNLATQQNNTYKKNLKLDAKIIRETDVIDPFLTFHDINIGTNGEPRYITTSPAPCMGLINELITRSKKFPLCHTLNKIIEVDPDKHYMYGELISENNGAIKNFEINRTIELSSRQKSIQDEEYLIVDFKITDLDYSSNYISQGLPSLVFFGILISEEIEKKLDVKDDLQFSIGIKNIVRGKSGMFTLSGKRPDELIEGCIVLKGKSKAALLNAQAILKHRSEFNLPDAKLTVVSTSLSNIIHSAYWLVDSNENISNLQEDTGLDSLDVALLLSSKNVLSIPLAVGFAFLSEPKRMLHINNQKEHVWSELMFKSIFLIESNFDELYLIEKKYNSENQYYLWEASK